MASRPIFGVFFFREYSCFYIFITIIIVVVIILQFVLNLFNGNIIFCIGIVWFAGMSIIVVSPPAVVRIPATLAHFLLYSSIRTLIQSCLCS